MSRAIIHNSDYSSPAVARDGVQDAPRFVARPDSDVEWRIVREPAFRYRVRFDGSWRSRIELAGIDARVFERSLNLSGLLRPHHEYLGAATRSWAEPQIYPVLRPVFYNWIRAEIWYAFHRLCLRYGTTPDPREWTFFADAKR